MKIRRLQRDEMLLLVLLISLAGMGLVGYQDYQRGQKISSLEQELERTRADAASTKETLKQTSDELSLTREARDTFEEKYLDEKGRMDTLALQLSTIQSSVGILEKLSKIDKELLKKYSKVYFLNENYIPEKLVPVDTTYAYNAKNTFQVQQNIAPHLQNLLKDATAAGIDIKVISAYRSFDTQGELKQSYKVVYGAGTANQFSADQGYSEHQLGTAVDFTTSSLGSNFSSFEKTPAYAWLITNAHKYGFVLSYPKGNDYYIFEPWHWRFVSRNLAGKLYEDNKNFYDLDQRVLDTYLLGFFD